METVTPVELHCGESPNWMKNTQWKAVDPTHYRGMVGTLMYLTASRPDLTFVIFMCARNQEKPTEKHLHAIKRIFKYLRGTETYLLAGSSKSRKVLRYPVRKLNNCLAGCCAQVLRMRSQLTDYGLGFNKISNQVENGVVELYFVNTEYQLADIFTKALGRERIEFFYQQAVNAKFYARDPETIGR
ncbi:hypothetical protein Tco_0908262 [Tanacetum coccineum]|uniref:Uncharacterized protein n=1 Tax=Tanacetum coccineum TaxID=301880 RepID=A0ABQ5CNJ3_9ASTR